MKSQSPPSNESRRLVSDKNLWILVCAGCILAVFLLCAISRLANRGLDRDAKHIRKGGAAAMRRAAVNEALRINRMLKNEKTLEVVQAAKRHRKNKRRLAWSRQIEQILHDLAYGIGSMRTIHLIFGVDPDLRAEMTKRHVPFDDLFLELEDTSKLIVDAL